jgi:hypothetical protein
MYDTVTQVKLSHVSIVEDAGRAPEPSGCCGEEKNLTLVQNQILAIQLIARRYTD